MNQKFNAFIIITFLLAGGGFSESYAAEIKSYTITIKDHLFTPDRLTVPANEKVKLIIKNEDPTPEEFESHDLNREKIVTGNGKITIFIGPLKPGEYKYFGEFHEDTAQGVIVAENMSAQ